MRRIFVIVALAFATLPALAQTGVFFSSNAWTAATNVPVGSQAPIYTIPYATISICTDASCATPVNVYNTSSLTGTPLVQPLTASAVGVYGFWAAPGNYWQLVCAPSGSCTPGGYITLGGSGGTSFTLNTLAGAVSLGVGNGLTLSTSGNTITIGQGTAFSITNFSGGSTVELGTSVVNPTFSAAYSTMPASASITNTENIGSPAVLTSPFTSGTVIGTFAHGAIANTTFTLTAIQGSTQVATQSINWQPAIFSGVGVAGATSSVTASGTTAVLSNGISLSRVQLSAETVGQTFGPLNTLNQSIYLLLTGGSHTFFDVNTGFPFVMNAAIAVSFVNSKGVTVTMYLYQSTNSLYGTYAPKIVS
jgi:hypothetical protein